jgi:hypothetical protein
MLLGQKKLKNKKKLQLIVGNLGKYGPTLIIQKSLTMKWLRFSKKKFLI